MKYENLKLEIITLVSSGVIATSAEVTTDGITMPWKTSEENTVSYTDQGSAVSGAYETDI